MVDNPTCSTKTCARCRVGFDNGAAIYAQLELRERFYCCVSCGDSYGEKPHPDLPSSTELERVAKVLYWYNNPAKRSSGTGWPLYLHEARIAFDALASLR